MSTATHLASGQEFAGDFLAHYGVKGMKWGVRKDRGGVERTKVRTTHAPGARVKATGGTGQAAHPDAVRAAVRKQKAQKSTTDALSDKELKALINRLQMEQQYSQLRPKSASEKTLAFVGGLLLNLGRNQVSSIASQAVTKQVAKAMDKKK
jgi:hypothetical protein